MPWTEAKDLTQAVGLVECTGRDNAGVLINPFHLSRSHGRIEEIATHAPARLHFMQLCDVPAAIPETMDAIPAGASACLLAKANSTCPACCAPCLGREDQPIAGLDAVGTDMASVMGGFYPSGGINLGPAPTFGSVAAVTRLQRRNTQLAARKSL